MLMKPLATTRQTLSISPRLDRLGLQRLVKEYPHHVGPGEDHTRRHLPVLSRQLVVQVRKRRSYHLRRPALGGWRGYTPVVALDVTTGEQRWRLDLDGKPVGEPAVGPWGTAVPILGESRLLFLDAQDGSTIGEATLSAREQDPDATPLLRRSGERFCLAGCGGRYYDLERPWRSWRTLFEHPQGIASMAPVVLGDLAVFMDSTGQLCCRPRGR